MLELENDRPRIPEANAMPDLRDLTPAFPVLVQHIALAAGGPRDIKGRRHVVHFVRTADLAVAQYQAARSALESSLSTESVDKLLHAFSAIDSLECCMISLKRSIDALFSVSRYEAAPSIPRELRRSISSYADEITDVRDAVVHMDRLITTGELEDGQPVALVIAKDGASATVSSYKLEFGLLGSVLRNLNRLAHELTRYRESQT